MRVPMVATVFSTLRGKLVGKHPTLGAWNLVEKAKNAAVEN